MAGYSFFNFREPNPTHTCLATLEKQGFVNHLITQNVDRLHHKAGQQRVIELHGNNETMLCMSCREMMTRAQFQDLLQASNPEWSRVFSNTSMTRPDGDVDLGQVDYSQFNVPGCPCGGLMKPEIVFFGENVPVDIVAKAMDVVCKADGILTIGSSLQVYSVFRFLQAADKNHIPIGILNIGPTRADDLRSVELKLEGRSGQVLPVVLSRILVKPISY